MVAHILHPPSPAVSAVPLHPPTHTSGQGSHVPVIMLLYSELLMHVLTGGEGETSHFTDYYKQMYIQKNYYMWKWTFYHKLCNIYMDLLFFFLQSILTRSSIFCQFHVSEPGLPPDTTMTLLATK